MEQTTLNWVNTQTLKVCQGLYQRPQSLLSKMIRNNDDTIATWNGNDLTHALVILFTGQETKLKDEYLQWSDNQIVRGTIYNLSVEV